MEHRIFLKDWIFFNIFADNAYNYIIIYFRIKNYMN